MRPNARRILLAFTAAAILLLANAALAGPNDSYAVVTLINETPYRVDYSYGWGDGRLQHSNHIPGRKRHVHWWTFKYRGQDYAPFFYVQLEGDSSRYKLRSFYSPDTEEENGRVYYIRWDSAQSTFALYGKLYTD